MRMTERAERLARPAARQSIGRKSQIAANARPPVRCARPRPRKRGLLRVSLYSAAELLISAGRGLLVRFGDQRAIALAGDLCLVVHAATGKSLRGHVAGLLGSHYSSSQMSYDLRRRRLRGLIERTRRDLTSSRPPPAVVPKTGSC